MEKLLVYSYRHQKAQVNNNPNLKLIKNDPYLVSITYRLVLGLFNRRMKKGKFPGALNL